MSPGLMAAFSHTHASAWFLTLLLFAIAFVFLRKGNGKALKITQMILRLFFVIMLISGLGMIVAYQFPAIYILKGLLAFALIGLMEMILVRSGKGKNTKPLWLSFVVVLPIVLLIGFNVIRF